MPNNAPSITVLMPVFNGQDYLKEAIDSILNQSYNDFEFLIINDGSTDNSEAIVKSYNDARIKLVRNETNIKLIASLNKGIQLAKGKYIARMDSDDISHPDRLKKQVEFLESHPEIGVCGTWFESIEKDSIISKYPQDDATIRIRMLYQCPFCHPTVMYRKNILTENNLSYNVNFAHAEDYELWVQLSKYTHLANIPEVLLKYRIHTSNISQQYRGEQKKNSHIIVQEQFKRLKIDLHPEDYQLYLKIAYSEFNFSMKELTEAKKLLSILSKNNDQLKIIPTLEFNNYLGEKWFTICTNSTFLGPQIYALFFNSSLAKKHKLSLLEKLFFFTKCLILKK